MGDVVRLEPRKRAEVRERVLSSIAQLDVADVCHNAAIDLALASLALRFTGMPGLKPPDAAILDALEACKAVVASIQKLSVKP